MDNVRGFTQYFLLWQEILVDKEVPYLCPAFGCLEKYFGHIFKSGFRFAPLN